MMFKRSYARVHASFDSDYFPGTNARGTKQATFIGKMNNSCLIELHMEIQLVLLLESNEI